jgi:hypothetical protein
MVYVCDVSAWEYGKCHRIRLSPYDVPLMRGEVLWRD